MSSVVRYENERNYRWVVYDEHGAAFGILYADKEPRRHRRRSVHKAVLFSSLSADEQRDLLLAFPAGDYYRRRVGGNLPDRIRRESRRDSEQ